MAIGMVDEDEQGRALPKVIEGIPLNIDGHRTWFDGDVLIDGTVAVDNVLQRDDGSFCLSVTVRRPLSDDTVDVFPGLVMDCLLYTSPSPRDRTRSRMPSSA